MEFFTVVLFFQFIPGLYKNNKTIMIGYVDIISDLIVHLLSKAPKPFEFQDLSKYTGTLLIKLQLSYRKFTANNFHGEFSLTQDY